MLKKIILSVLFIVFISCEKEDMAPLPVSNQSTLVSKGDFVPTSGIVVSGEAGIYIGNNNKKVILKNFSISEGPDLKVYLSKSATPEDFVNLGDLTSSTVYLIPEMLDLTQYK